jgi:hypothetical protein
VDPYALLELEPGASLDEVKRAWKRLARVHHPDLNPGDPEAAARFVRIKDAYEMLLEGRGPVAAARGADADWVDAVQWMATVRQREVLEDLLPRFVAAYGTGAALAWALRQAEDFEAAARALPAHRPPWRLRRLGLEAIVDDGPGAWGLASIEKGADGKVKLVLFAEALWRRRPDGEEQLRQLVFSAVDHGLAAAAAVALRLPRAPASLEEARAFDKRVAFDRWFWRAVWAGTALLSAAMIGWALMGGSGGL